MSPNPFVWESQVRREVLDAEMAELREIPYSLWRNVIGVPISKVVTARDDRPYNVRVTAEYEGHGSNDIRVTLTLSRPGGLRRKLMQQAFVITPENRFRT